MVAFILVYLRKSFRMFKYFTELSLNRYPVTTGTIHKLENSYFSPGISMVMKLFHLKAL